MKERAIRARGIAIGTIYFVVRGIHGGLQILRVYQEDKSHII